MGSSITGDLRERRVRMGLVPIQWFATDQGMLDFTKGPGYEEVLQQVKRAGFEGAPLEVPAGWSVARYRGLLDRLGMVPGPGYLEVVIPEDGGARPDLVESAKALARVHAEFGLSEMYIAAGWSATALRVRQPAQGAGADATRLDRVIELFGVLCEAAVAEGVRPMLHQHVGTFIETEAEARRVLDSLDVRLMGFGPDTGHLAWVGADVVKMVTDYRQRVSGVHLKDCRVSVAEKAGRSGFTYQQTVLAGVFAEPGRGELPLSRVLDALPTEFSGWILAELDQPDVSPDPFESAKVSAAWLSEHVRRG